MNTTSHRFRPAAFLLVCLCLFLFGSLPVAAADAIRMPDWQPVDGVAAPPELSARAAVLLDSESGMVLYALNPHLVLPAASLTKVVAIHAAVVADRRGEFDLESTFVPSAETWASNQPPGSSLMFLGPDQLLSNGDLLAGLAVSSGNDAAVALALRVDGSVEQFAQRMTATVREAGLNTMSFVEPSGLSPLNLITAFEYAAFVQFHVAEFPELLEGLYALPSYTYPQPENRTGAGEWPPIIQYNRNSLLETYAGADGVKTGFIDESGYHLAATATRDGRRLIAVVLGVSAPSHAEGGRIRAADASALLDYGFREFEVFRFGHPAVEPVRVYKGRNPLVDPAAPGTLVVSVPVGGAGRLRGGVQQITEVVAPVFEGATIGMIDVSLDGVVLASSPVVMPEVERGGFFRRLWDSVVLTWRAIFGTEAPADGASLPVTRFR